VLSEVHRGGQGVVYQAIQESTRNKVAIKVLKHGPFADSTEFARFDREVDVLSRLNHPHIVSIRDRGMTAGHAYFVMEFVPGQPLDGYVAGMELELHEILRLFITVCNAVNVAHLRGVIHRDLKPGNIRVTDEGEPRILDFGLAKLEADQGSSAADMTVTGQFVGSLPWASPEQAEGRSQSLDIRTDVYSLGVILYHLLTGRFPYPLSGKLSEVVRHISHTPPARISMPGRRVDHDLELIIYKCLAKEPERRYQSAGDLALDIQRYLANEPILAQAASAKYLLKKFVQRNRRLVAAVVAMAMVLVVATSLSTALWFREARQRKAAQLLLDRAERAERESSERADQLEKAVAFQAAQLSGIDPKLMGAKLREDLLQKARAEAERANASQSEIDGRVKDLEGLIAGSDFTGMALSALDENVFKPALKTIQTDFEDQPLIKARLLQTLATTLQTLGMWQQATAPQEEALAIRRELLGDLDPESLASRSAMGSLLYSLGQQDEAEEHYRSVLDDRRKVLGELDPATLDSINNMGRLSWDRGRLREAEAYFREALVKRRQVLGDEHRDTLITMGKLGGVLRNQGNLNEAEPLLREALRGHQRTLGENDRNTLIAMGAMASFFRASGKLEDAEQLFREALEKSRVILGEAHRDTLIVRGNLGSLLMAQQKHIEAEALLRESLDQRRRILGNHHRDTLSAITDLGAVLWMQGRLEDAQPFLREALERSRAILGEDNADTLTAANNMGVALRKLGRLAEAEPFLREVVEKSRRLQGEAHPETLVSIGNLGGLWQAMGKNDEAVDLLGAAEVSARQVLSGPSAVVLGRWLTALGRARTAIESFDQAESNLTDAHGILQAALGARPSDREEVLTGLIDLFEARHARDPAKGYDRTAAEWKNRREVEKVSVP